MFLAIEDNAAEVTSNEEIPSVSSLPADELGLIAETFKWEEVESPEEIEAEYQAWLANRERELNRAE